MSGKVTQAVDVEVRSCFEGIQQLEKCTEPREQASVKELVRKFVCFNVYRDLVQWTTSLGSNLGSIFVSEQYIDSQKPNSDKKLVKGCNWSWCSLPYSDMLQVIPSRPGICRLHLREQLEVLGR
jgi:hypothetical protein